MKETVTTVSAVKIILLVKLLIVKSADVDDINDRGIDLGAVRNYRYYFFLRKTFIFFRHHPPTPSSERKSIEQDPL